MLLGGTTYPGPDTFPGSDRPRRSNPFDITIYNKNFQFVGLLNDVTSLTVTPRHNQISTADIEIPSNHRRGAALEADGARAVIEYEGEHLMSGYILSADGQGPSKGGTTTYHLTDDLWLMWRMLGWPVPGADLVSQGVKKDTRTGNAEAVLKGFVSANKAHLVDSITVATNLNRGGTITKVESRMAVLADVLMTLVDQAGIGVSVRQSGSGLLVDVYVPSVFPHTLSEQSGSILNWSWSKSQDTLTSAIIGGPNEDTSREFRRIRSSARETALGYTIEGFVDARSAENYAEMDQAGTDAIAAGGPTGGFKVSLSESKHFRYGGDDGVHVGDTVTVDIGGRTRTDVLREASMTYTQADGLQITPAVGDQSDNPDRTLVRYISQLAAAVRSLRTR